MNLSYPKELVKHGKVKQISNLMFEVGDHSVKIQTRQGRKMFICDCENSSYFGHNSFCIHKVTVIGFLWDQQFNERITKLIKEYENYKYLKLPVSIDCMLNDLKNVKNLK